MKINEITEAIERANNTAHLKNRIKLAARLCDSMGDYPLLFRDFQTKTPGFIVLGKITNTITGGVKSGIAGYAQTEIMDHLGVEDPVFTKMTKPNSTQGPFGDSHIFIPPPGSKSFWSPKIKDIGSQTVAEDREDWSGARAKQLASTYKAGLPTNYTDHEIIFDCNMYYLVNVQAFLKNFAGEANKEFIEKSRYSNVRMKIDPAIFDAHITNYSQLSWYLKNTAIDFLNDYDAKIAEFKAKQSQQPKQYPWQ